MENSYTFQYADQRTGTGHHMGADCGAAVAGNNSSRSGNFDRFFAQMLPFSGGGSGHFSPGKKSAVQNQDGELTGKYQGNNRRIREFLRKNSDS